MRVFGCKTLMRNESNIGRKPAMVALSTDQIPRVKI